MAIKKRNKKRLLGITALVVVGGALIVYAVARSHTSKKTAVKTSEPAVSQEQATSADNLNKPTDTTNASGDATTSAATSATTSSGAKIYVLINSPVNNSTIKLVDGLQLRATITGVNSGSCALKLTGPSGQSVSKSADLMQQNGYASCGIDVAGSQLATGDWTLSLTATSGGTTTSAITQKVTVE